jgi:hypothetical protein
MFEERLDPRSIRLADIDGTGTADLFYIGKDGVRAWINQSGNAWSAPTTVGVFRDVFAGKPHAGMAGGEGGCLERIPMQISVYQKEKGVVRLIKQPLKRSAASCIIATLMLSAAALAEPKDDVYYRLNSSMIDAAHFARKTHGLTDTEIDLLQSRIADLQQRLEELPSGPPPAYLAAFQTYSEVFQRALRRSSSADVAQTWRVITSDVTLKLDYLNSVAGISADIGPYVTITIKTLHAGEEVSGLYLIQCNPRLIGDRTPAVYNSPTPARVSESKFLPGQYVCFAVADQRRVLRQEVSVGRGRRPEELVELLIP